MRLKGLLSLAPDGSVQGLFGIGWEKNYGRNRAAFFGPYMIAFFILLAVLSPWVASYEPLSVGKDSFQQSSSAYLMGTDDLGRDLFSGEWASPDCKRYPHRGRFEFSWIG